MIEFDFLEHFPRSTLTESHRSLRLYWGRSHAQLADVLLLHRIDVSEHLCGGVLGHLTCLSLQAGLPLKEMIGLPLAVQIVTAEGQLRSIAGIVSQAQAGPCDGGLAVYQLVLRDALSLLEQRMNHRIFRDMSVPAIIGLLLREWRDRSNILAQGFDFDLGLLDVPSYPPREFTHQFHESDAHFIRRLCKREGIGWFVAAGPSSKSLSSPSAANPEDAGHRLILFDAPLRLPQGRAGEVRFHRADATEESDTIQLWNSTQRLIPGSVARSSWDYKRAAQHHASVPAMPDQGPGGNDLAGLLRDTMIDTPHMGDSHQDHARLTTARMLAHERKSLDIQGAGTVRTLEVGHWFSLAGHPELDRASQEDREFIVTSLRHRAQSNLPKDLEERALALLSHQPETHLTPPTAAHRYWNSFTCLRRGLPLVPDYDPHVDLPRTYPITAVVVGPAGEEIHTDELGRIKVQLQGLAPEHHDHQAGAGTSGTERDSAYVRVSGLLAGPHFGSTLLPRVGMEVIVEFLHGDPDKLLVTGVLPNARNPPTMFSHLGSLPGNRFLSGIKTQEFHGGHYNQLRFDDTPGEISSQLASEHAHSQLNLGSLTQPRDQGHGQARGEGAELRTDAAAAVRAARGILMTTFAQDRAAGALLDRAELTRLLEECSELLQALSHYADSHGSQAADHAPRQELGTRMSGWDSARPDSGQGIMVFGAAAGALHLTPKTQVSYAGQNLDTVAQQHLQLTSGQRTHITAGRGVFVFARQDGVSAIAHQGDLRLQAQADSLQANAQKDVLISANDGEVRITGKSITLIAEDGSYLRLGGGLTAGTQADMTLHAANHLWTGPDSKPIPPGTGASVPTDQQFRLRYATGNEEHTALAGGRQYRIRTEDGRVIDTTSDPQGLSTQVDAERMQMLGLDVLKPRI